MHKNYKEHVISVCKLHTGTFKSGDTALLSDFIVFFAADEPVLSYEPVIQQECKLVRMYQLISIVTD